MTKMGTQLLCCEKNNSMGIMDIFKNPSKKLRLDLAGNYEGTIANDDLWGDDEDITAEEFDMLEVQATQGNHQVDHSSFCQPRRDINCPRVSPLLPEEKQYEMEGKIKLLKNSIEKLSKELKEEKLDKEKLLNQKAQEFQTTENALHKEIQRLESTLQFKDHEMRTVYDKVDGLESQLREKTISETNKSPNKHLEKFQFQSISKLSAVESVPLRPNRKHKLLINIPQGKIAGSDIVSSILCNRLILSSSSNPYFTPIPNTHSPVEQAEKTSFQLSAMSIVRITSDEQTEELFDYFISVFKNYLFQLKSLSSVSVAITSAKSPLSIKKKDLGHEQVTVISCLKDLTNVISFPQFSFILKQIEHRNWTSSQKVCSQLEKTSSNLKLINCDERNIYKDKFRSLLQLLLCLINPDIYPSGFTKNESIEWSLAALVSWSSTVPESFIGFLDEIPVPLLVNCIHSGTYSYGSLKFITNMCTFKEFIPILTHRNDVCILCTIAEFSIRKIAASVLQYINIMILIETFYSTIFTVHSFVELNLESSPCSSSVLQGVITSLWKFYEVYDINKDEVTLVMKKGFSLIHLLSRYLPNFKGKRNGFEDYYISLVCGMLTLIKENSAFKDFYDIMHDLLDFQEDTSEFELEEASDDSSQMMQLSNTVTP